MWIHRSNSHTLTNGPGEKSRARRRNAEEQERLEDDKRRAKEATKVRWQKPKSRISTKRRIKFLNLVPSLFLDQKQQATGTRTATSNEMGTGGGAGRGRVGGGGQNKKKTTAATKPGTHMHWKQM